MQHNVVFRRSRLYIYLSIHQIVLQEIERIMLRRRRPDPPEKDKREVPDTPVQWRRMIAYLSPYKFRLFLAIIGLVFSAGLSLVFPAVIQNVVDSVFSDADLQLLDTITIVLLIVFVFRSIATFVQNYNLNFVGEKIVVDIRKELYEHLQSLSVKFFTERRVGELISRISSDVTVM